MTSWTKRALGEVATVGAGNSAPQDEALFANGSVPFFRTSDVGRIRFGDIDTATDLLNEHGAKGLRRFTSGTILFPKSGASTFLNHRVMMQVDGCVSSHLATIDARRELAEPRFLLYFLATVQAQDLVQDHSYPSLNLPLIADIEVPLPSLPEQRRIVAILEEAFEGIATAKANAEKNLQNARELFENTLQSMLLDVDGELVQHSMSDVCYIQSKLVDPREETYQELPHVGAGNIESKTGVLIDVLTARQEQLISGKFLFDESMVLYSKIRPYLMKVVRPDFSGLCSADIYPLAPKPGVITRDYLFYVLLSPEFTEYAIKGSARAGMPKVNREHLFAYELSLPTVQEQVRIAARLDGLAEEAQRMIVTYERRLTALAELKKSLLHQAFSGSL